MATDVIIPALGESITEASVGQWLKQPGDAVAADEPIVVPVESYKSFYPAEANHQNFMRLNPSNPYIVRWDAPKLAALKRLFPAFVRSSPAP